MTKKTSDIWANVKPILESIKKLDDEEFRMLMRQLDLLWKERSAAVSAKINIGDIVSFEPSRKKHRARGRIYLRVTEIGKSIRGIEVSPGSFETKQNLGIIGAGRGALSLSSGQRWRVEPAMCKIEKKS